MKDHSAIVIGIKQAMVESVFDPSISFTSYNTALEGTFITVVEVDDVPTAVYTTKAHNVHEAELLAVVNEGVAEMPPREALGTIRSIVKLK